MDAPTLDTNSSPAQKLRNEPQRSKRSKTISRAITYTGAIIIFVTFIIKDVIREQVRDLGDSINAAEIFYLTQTSIEQTQLQTSDLQMSLGNVGIAIIDQKSDEQVRYQHQMAILFATFVDKTSINEQYVKNLARLIQQLPHEEDQQKQADSLLSSCTEMKVQAEAIPKEFDALIKKYSQAIDEYAPPSAAAMAQIKALQKKAQSLQNDATAFGAKVRALTDAVLANAHQQEEKNKRLYSRDTVASYILYSLGWGLAFIGKLFFGTDQEESE